MALSIVRTLTDALPQFAVSYFYDPVVFAIYSVGYTPQIPGRVHCRGFNCRYHPPNDWSYQMLIQSMVV